MSAYFIADLHLQPERPDVTQAFLRFLSQEALLADRLYILGDFFNYWLGDDALTEFHQPILQALHDYSRSGRRLYFMRGNRDFTLGADFARKAGMTLLDDPWRGVIEQREVLLMHGDSLCQADRRYQYYRALIQHPWTVRTLCRLPLSWRRRLARALRRKSRKRNAHIPAPIMDVSPEAVTQCMQHQQVKLLIHGHTHRPYRHKIITGERIVLGDWDQKGWVLKMDTDSLHLESFPIA